MNREQFMGKWSQLKGKARKQWGKLTDNHVQRVNGELDILAGQLQELYGISKEEAENEIDDFCSRC